MRILKKNKIPVKETKLTKHNQCHNHFIQKDFEAFLNFCKNGHKRSDFLIIMNKPEMLLSPRALTEEIVTLQSLECFYKNNNEMLTKIRRLFTHYNKAEKMTFSMAIRYYRKIIGYDFYLKQHSKDSSEYEEYLHIADRLQNICKYQKQGEKSFCFWQRMKQEISTKETQEQTQITNGISVITMHSAKGLEFSHVFLPDVNEGIIPGKHCESKEQIEEERRLLYVAVTRAIDAITIYFTGERGRKPSRFLTGEKIITDDSN